MSRARLYALRPKAWENSIFHNWSWWRFLVRRLWQIYLKEKQQLRLMQLHVSSPNCMTGFERWINITLIKLLIICRPVFGLERFRFSEGFRLYTGWPISPSGILICCDCIIILCIKLYFRYDLLYIWKFLLISISYRYEIHFAMKTLKFLDLTRSCAASIVLHWPTLSP